MSAHLSLSPLLHFVLKFSIQKIKGGENTSERAGRGREEKKCHHGFHLESSANLPNRQQSPQKATLCPKNAHFSTAAEEKNSNLPFYRIWRSAFRTHTHTSTTLHTTLAMLLSEVVDIGGDVRTTKGFVVNTVVKRRMETITF